MIHLQQWPYGRKNLVLLTSLLLVCLVFGAAAYDYSIAHAEEREQIEVRQNSGPFSSTQIIRLNKDEQNGDTPRPIIRTTGAIGTSAKVIKPAGVHTASVKVMAQSPNDWTEDFYYSFEDDTGPFPEDWAITDEDDDFLDRTWGIDDFNAYESAQSVWVASGGSDGLDPENNFVPNGLHTWLGIPGYFDFSTAQAADVEFYMYMDTEPEADTIFVGVSLDDVEFYGEFWSGNSGGWEHYSLDLSEYAGYDEVYVAWLYSSDESNVDDVEYEGVWIDDVSVWSYTETGPPEATDTVQSGGFETGDFTNWVVPIESTALVIEETNPNEGNYVAWLGGAADLDEVFYQPVELPDTDATHVSFGFWINQFGEETKPEADRFCAGLYGSSTGSAGLMIDLDNPLVDLGCLDGLEAYTTDFDPDEWWQVDYLLGGDEWESVRGETVFLTFEMITDGEANTYVYIDDVTMEIVTGGSQGDRLEPNDWFDEATIATTPITYTSLTIDPDYDYDGFRVEANAGDTIVVNVDADVKGSPLDAVAMVVDEEDTLVCENDDDEFSLDPYISCTVESGGPYFVVVSSYDEGGDRSNVYDLSIEVIPPGGEAAINTESTNSETPQAEVAPDTWTAMIYMDGDTNLCGVYPGLVNRVEQELGGKIGPDGFMNVLVLLDRIPIFCEGEGTATRYHVQPDGNYTDGTNRWEMGELNMGDPQTLQSFIEWAMRNYPADHYYLAIDDHGAGVTGIAWDDSNRDVTNKKDKLTNPELFSVLKGVTKNGEDKLDILAYEACLMGTYENAYDVRNFAENLFFFPTISFTNNEAYPSYFKDGNFNGSTSGQEFGNIMFDVYRQSVTSRPYAMTLVKTAEITTVHTALNDFSVALQNEVAANSEKIKLARNFAQKIDSNGDDSLTDDDQYIDLWDLADKVAAQGLAIPEAAALKAAIEAAVVRTDQLSMGTLDYENNHGLAIFWPQTASSWYRPYVNDRVYTSTRDGQWDEFLQTFFGEEGGRPGMQTDPGPAERELAGQAGSTLIYLPFLGF